MVRCQIQDRRSELAKLFNNKDKIENWLLSQIPREHWEQLKELAQSSGRALARRKETVQNEKMKCLALARERKVDLSKSVVNLSTEKLSSPELAVLRKGLNFCPNPVAIPRDDLVIGVE